MTTLADDIKRQINKNTVDYVGKHGAATINALVELVGEMQESHRKRSEIDCCRLAYRCADYGSGAPIMERMLHLEEEVRDLLAKAAPIAALAKGE